MPLIQVLKVEAPSIEVPSERRRQCQVPKILEVVDDRSAFIRHFNMCTWGSWVWIGFASAIHRSTRSLHCLCLMLPEYFPACR